MKYFYSFILLFFSFSPLYAYKIGEVVKTEEGDLGVVFYIDQERVLLVSPIQEKVQFCTMSNFDECLSTPNCDEHTQNLLFNGRECTNRMKKLSDSLSYEFPILNVIPFERGWFIPSLAEMHELYRASRSHVETSTMYVVDVLKSIGGSPIEKWYWTTSRCLYSGNFSPMIQNYADTAYYVCPIYQIDLINKDLKDKFDILWNTGSTETRITDSPKSSTTYTVIATNTLNACKSTASRKVLVAGEPQEIYETICEGETYSGYGFKENTTGTYTKSVGEQNCITEVSLHLTVAPKYKQVFDDVACMGQYYNKHGFSLTPFVKGAFHDTLSFISQLGCDSTVILNLNVKPTTYDTITRRICQDETYKDPDFDIEANHRAGLTYYTVEKTNEEGCRAYHTLALQVDSVYQVTTLATVEEGAAYNQQGFNIDKVIPGNAYRLELNAVNGCDSIVTLYFRMLHGEEIGPNPNPNPNPEGEGLKDNRIIPTAFTPHFEDDMNDHFMLGYEVYIYDRYGNLICHSENGWDGTYRGKVATPGVYVYTVFMKDGEIRKGTIEVVKSK